MHSALWNCKQPYNVNVAAQQAAIASLGSLPFLAANVEKIKTERQRMYQRLAEIPYLEPVPGSQSNYILCRVNDRPAATLNADLIRQGIFTRYYNSGRLKDYLRISIGKPEDTDILIDMLYALGNPALAAGSALRPVRPAPDRGRKASVQRATQETFIEVSINLDGSGACQVNTGIPFFDHMLTQIAVHGLFDLAVNASGDLEVDVHHTIEDVALTLGNAFLKALGDRKGIVRMADVRVPIDETLAELTLDLSGRPYAVVHINWTAEHAGGIPVSMFTHFFESFAGELRCNLHLSIPYGRDTHHQAEAAFKALARALSTATRIDPRRQGAIPSSKGELF
jgi:imidazoleglycerol-phosphate dehydratase